MLISEIEEIISKGENSNIEFKEENIRPNDLAAEIVAFANTEGGTLFIGVTDNKQIVGVSDHDIEEKIMNICKNNCIPYIIPVYEKVILDGKSIVVLQIPKGQNKSYYTVDNKYYVRVGTTKRIASKEQRLRLFESSGYFHYDISQIPNTNLKNLNIDVIRDYFEKYNTFDLYEESNERVKRILMNADIMKEVKEETLCTAGGILIFGKNPADQLPQNGISFAHFNGEDITEDLIDKKQIVGRLPDIAEQTMTILKNNMKTHSSIEGVKRHEKVMYPDVVLREAVINALVHRNYSIVGSKIRIFMFSNRVEFRSPGRIPNTVTIDKMKIGVSYARNPFLVKYMENLRYIDQLGRGIPMILKTMKELGMREPKLEESGEELIITIYNS